LKNLPIYWIYIKTNSRVEPLNTDQKKFWLSTFP